MLYAQNYGWRLENVVAIEIMRRLRREYQTLHYMLSNKEFEVDFVVRDRNVISQLIQVTYDFRSPSTKLYNREINGLVKAADKTGCKNLFLIMMEGDKKDIVVDDKTIHCVLATDWLLNTNL